jgi:multimeric flavodoxin WrbA
VRVLGLVASARKMGNTELMIKEALLGARDAGAEVALLRLTDLRILPCNGCMACVFKRQPCRLVDDMAFLLEELRGSQGVLLGAPTYFYGPAGIVKMIVDRLLMLEPGQLDGRPAGTIGTAGRAVWTPFTLSQLNLLPLLAGFRIVGSLLIEGPGPGECLLDSYKPASARDLGRRVALGISQDKSSSSTEPRCPICYGTAFRLVSREEVECPLCGVLGHVKWQENRVLVEFSADSLCHSRFSEQSRVDHLENWVLGTECTYRSRLAEVLHRRQAYASLGIPWKCPSRE